VSPYRAPGVHITAVDAERIAETTLEYGWYAPMARRMVSFEDLRFEDPAHSESTRRSLHAWEPIDPLLLVSTEPPSAALEGAAAYAHSWIEWTPDPLEPELGTAGRRAVRLAFLAATHPSDRIADAAAELEVALAGAIDPSDGTLATLDAITGLLSLLRRSDDVTSHPVDAATVRSWLAVHLDAAFTSDGVHRSQAPGIQQQAIDRLAMLIDARIVSDPELTEVRNRAEHALAWFITPDGTPANFGATPSHAVSSAYDPIPSGVRHLPDRISEPTLLYASSRGRYGTRPEVTRLVLREGGFFVVKEPWPARALEDTPLVHLQARTGPPVGGTGIDAGLAFTWHDAGRKLIVEPGPAPAGESDSVSRYADEPDAHNRIVRSGPENAQPHLAIDSTASGALSGGLQRWGVMEGAYFCDSYESTAGLGHRRSLLYEPGAWLIVADVIDAPPDETMGPRFHLADDLGIRHDTAGFTWLDGPRPIGWAVSLSHHEAMTPQRGVDRPRASGWWSPDGERMVPNWVFGWDAVGPTTFVTLLALDRYPTVEQRQGAWFGWRTSGYQARVAVTEWGIVDIDIRQTADQGT
jgi:hypothetical protein